MQEPSELQKEYRKSLALLREQRQRQYQQFLESFASDALKIIREVRTLNDGDSKALIDGLEEDWKYLRELKNSL